MALRTKPDEAAAAGVSLPPDEPAPAVTPELPPPAAAPKALTLEERVAKMERHLRAQGFDA